jgi:hypothetical protein
MTNDLMLNATVILNKRMLSRDAAEAQSQSNIANFKSRGQMAACVRLPTSAGNGDIPIFVQASDTVFSGKIPVGINSGDHFKVRCVDDGEILVKCPEGKLRRWWRQGGLTPSHALTSPL